MFGSIGSFEIMIIFFVILLLFGSKQLPQAAKTIGKGIRDFQRATQNARNEITRIIEEDDVKDVKKEVENKPDEGKSPDELKG